MSKQCAGNGKPLLLTAGEGISIFTDRRIIAERKRINKGFDTAQFTDLIKFLFLYFPYFHFQIFTDTATEENNVLRYISDLAAKRLCGKRAKIVFTDPNIAAFKVKKP